MKRRTTHSLIALLFGVFALAGAAAFGFANTASADGQTVFGLSNDPADWDRTQPCVEANEWHFIINGLAEQGQTVWTAPETIQVTWSDGTTTDVPLTNLNKAEAGYTDTAHLALDVVSAQATIPLSEDGRPWDGQFNLSHGPCGQVASPPDLFITISPDGTNRVGADHTFTVTVTQKIDSDGDFDTEDVPAVGVFPTVTLDPVPDGVTDNCADLGTNDLGQCTVVINSSTTGVFTANAAITLEVCNLGGECATIPVDTAGDSGPGGSIGAVKTYVDARIGITPTETNRVGDDHTFTVLVEADNGSGSFAPVEGAIVDVSFDIDPENIVSNSCADPGTDVDGECTVVINSTTTGVFTATAATTINVAGLDIDLITDGQNGSSDPAVKTYVDAKIRITPDGVNRVGSEHTFTVTVSADDGSGSFVGVEGAIVDVSFDVDPETIVSNSCATGTDADGKCTVVINSTATGIFVATASTTVTVAGLDIDLTTDGIGSNSGPATKRYVDATISIGPSATNPLNQSHTFTVTVLADTGNGDGFEPVVGQFVTVTFQPAPGTKTDNCDAPDGTNAAGQCTVIINSSVPGAFVANASTTVTVAGLDIVLTTNGLNGSSGPATKTYVGFGCTPGYWKQSQHFDSWVGYAPSQTVASALFTNTGRQTTTLVNALALQGGTTVQGAKDILLRAAVSSLLNSTAVTGFPLTTQQVIDQVNAAMASNNRVTILALATQLDGYNNYGCPLN